MEASPKVSSEQRKELLAGAVASEVHRGWSVESQTDFQAVLVKGHRPNHLLHLVLTLVTLGIWVIVWIIVAATNRERRHVITINEYGQRIG